MSDALVSWFGTTGHVSAAQRCARAMIIREALHQAGIDEIEKARRLVLEPSGKISIVRDSIPPEQHQAAIGETPHV